MTFPTGMTGGYGHYRATTDAASSRPFVDSTDDPRQVVAEVIARRDGWVEIRPKHWADAGAIVKALKDRGMIRSKRERNAAG